MSKLNKLVEEYNSRLKSYEFLFNKIQPELAKPDSLANKSMINFYHCESKRLHDLIQLCKQILGDLEKFED